MPATIFSGSTELKSYRSNLSLNDVTKILSVSGNPASGAGTAAPVGSLALDYSNGKTYKKTGSLNTEWSELGSGVGGINYVVNPDAESGTTGWSTYADAAGAQPVDGTGGSPSVTWTRSTTTPLRGTADFNFVKDAVNRQGQGVSYDFTIDNADLAKVLTVSFDYEILSGTYANGDLTVYLIQDPAGTPLVVQPAGYTVLAGTVGTKLKQIATFQTDSAIKTYRLCFHVASTNTSAYSLAVDNVVVGPQVVQYGAPVTDWVSYTPTITTSSGTLTNYTTDFKWRRIGDSIEILGRLEFTGAAGTWTQPRFSLPPGLSIDSSKINLIDSDTAFGIATLLDSSVTPYSGRVVSVGSSTGIFTVAREEVSVSQVITSNITQAAPFAFGTGDEIKLSCKFPILGWSSTVQMSNDTDTRVVAARYVANQTQNITANTATKLVLGTKEFDTHSAFDSVNNQYVVPISGYYRITAMIAFINVPNNTTTLNAILFKNGSSVSDIAGTQAINLNNQHRVNGTQTVFANAGDTLYVAAYSGGALFTINQNSVWSYTEFQRLSGPSAIASSETVAARYTSTAGTTVPIGGLGAGLVPVPFATKDYDSHGFFNGSTGVGTIPISGVYRISSSAYFPSLSWTAFGKAIWIRKNGSSLAVITSYTPASASTTDLFLGGSVELRFNAGDTFDLNLFHNESSTRTLSTLAGATQITIVRIGN